MFTRERGRARAGEHNILSSLGIIERTRRGYPKNFRRGLTRQTDREREERERGGGKERRYLEEGEARKREFSD